MATRKQSEKSKNTIYGILEKRANNEGNDLEKKLLNVLGTIRKIASDHQKRVFKFFPEYDMHDESHISRVEQNIFYLLGKKAKSLSSYELFLLSAGAYLHDVGMAPSDWEENLLRITEGTDDFCEWDKSIRHDGKKPFNEIEARKFIQEKNEVKKKDLEGNDHPLIYDFGKWENVPFAPASKECLLDEFSKILCEYQSYRNGEIDRLKAVKTLDEFKKVNAEIRRDFLRRNHHEWSYRYVSHLARLFSEKTASIPNPKKLADDLAKVCKAHGESLTFIENKIESQKQYSDENNVNLQFVAEMIRLGDIIHFSSERAPMALMGAMDFKSAYSRGQWKLKADTRLEYTIKNGVVKYTTDDIDEPSDYYALKDYIDGVRNEIKNYEQLSTKWDELYKIDMSVDDKGVTYNADSFTPARGVTFSLDKKRIMDLLMGVQLYKEKYACLRELYQNSLDACRCRIAKDNARKITREGVIEFGIEEREGDEHYLYCKDNGTGMTKEIIEKYLLHVGSSYYKSADFRRQQAEDGHTFTPVSQFGIGILSCFMIGNRIEIATKTEGAQEIIACTIEQDNEYMYYRKPTMLEENDIIKCNGGIGTIVKIRLNDECSKELSVDKLEKPWLFLNTGFYNDWGFEDSDELKPYFDAYKNHLYKYLDDYIVIVPDGVTVCVKTADVCQKIVSKPYQLKLGEMGVTKEDLKFLLKGCECTYNELMNNICTYPVNVMADGVELHTVIGLSTSSNGYISGKCQIFRSSLLVGRKLAVDGIAFRKDLFRDQTATEIELGESEIVNYVGRNRPQLSADRISVVKYPDNNQQMLENLAAKTMWRIFKIAKQHIIDNHIEDQAIISAVWSDVLYVIELFVDVFANRITYSECGDVVWQNLASVMGKDITFKDFMMQKDVVVENYDFCSFDSLTRALFKAKFLSADTIKICEGNKLRLTVNKQPCIPDSLFNDYYFVLVDDNNSAFRQYDIITNLFPLVPERFAKSFDKYYIHYLSDHNAVKLERFYELSNLSDLSTNPTIHDFLGGKFSIKQLSYSYKESIDKLLARYIFLNTEDGNGAYLITYMFISPSQLTQEQQEELESIKSDVPTYYEGVTKGWSVLFWDCVHLVIKPGRQKREDMVKEMPDRFWKMNEGKALVFSDGTPCKKQ